MSTAKDGGEEKKKKNISIQVRKTFLDEFDMAVTQAQANGDIPLDASRSDVLRDLMEKAKENPELFK